MSTDRNLLFGILAYQLSFVNRDQLVDGMQAWVLNKNKSLSEIFLATSTMDLDQLQLLDALVDKHIAKHGGSVELSLQHLSSIDTEATQWLGRIEDAGLQATLSHCSVRASEFSISPGKSPAAQRDSSRFRIIRPHARGGLGEVYLAEDTEVSREVALKEIQERFAHSEDSRVRFLREAEITGRLEHPGIVPVYGLGTYADGRPFYAMKFIKGDSLKDAISQFHTADEDNASEPFMIGSRGIKFRELLRRFIDVCHAVHYAHSRGILHRDLKPGNVMIGEYGETLVVDWGLAKVLGERTQDSEASGRLLPKSGSGSSATLSGSAVGTPAYMSPEQAAGRIDDLGPASDVYSLGSTLYHLLTGKAPFGGSNLSNLLSDVQAGKFPPPSSQQPGIPKALEALCLKAMALAPSDRYASPQALAADLEKFLADEPTSAFTEPLVWRVRRWVRKHQTIAATTAAVLVLSSIGMGVFSTVLSGKNAQLKSSNEMLSEANNRERHARELAEANEQAAREQSQLALSTLTSVIDDIQGGLVGLPGGSEVRRRLLATSLSKLQAVSTQYLSKASVDESTFTALLAMGDVILKFGADSTAVGSTADPQAPGQLASEQLTAVQLAQSYFQRAFEIAKAMRTAGRNRVSAERDLAVVMDKLGNLSMYVGRSDQALEYFQDALKVLSAIALDNTSDAKRQHDLAIAYSNVGDALTNLGRTDDALATYEKCMEIDLALAKSDPQDARLQRSLAVSHNKLGELFMNMSRTTDALTQFERGLVISRQLSVSDPENVLMQRDLATSLTKVAEACIRLGRTEQALENYLEGWRIGQALAKSDPKDTEKQRDLFIKCIKLGDVLVTVGRTGDALQKYEDALIAIQPLAEVDSKNIDRQRDLAIAHRKLGIVLATLGRTQDALTQFEKETSTIRVVANADRSNVTIQRDLAIAYDNFGDSYLKLSRTNDALKQFQNAFEIRLALTELDPENTQNQHDVSISYSKLGDANLALGRLDDALENYKHDLAIADKLAKADPQDTEKQQGLSVAHERIGNIYQKLARFEDALVEHKLCLRIRRELAEADPNDAKKQKNLSYAIGNVGDLYVDLKRPDEALEHHEASLEIRNRLAESDPQDADKQRDLFLGYLKLADINQALDSFEYEEQYEQAHEIAQTLVKADPNDTERQSDLALIQERLGTMYVKLNRKEAALKMFDNCLAIRQNLSEADPDDAVKRRELFIGHLKIGNAHMITDAFSEAAAAYESAEDVVQGMIEQSMNIEQSKKELTIVQTSIKAARSLEKAFMEWDQLIQQPADALPALLEMRCIRLIKRGRVGEAHQAATKLTELDNATNKQLFHAACIFSLCATSIKAKGNEELTLDQFTQRRKWIDESLKTLKMSIEKGWTDVQTIERNTDFQILQNNPEFRSIVAQLKEDTP